MLNSVIALDFEGLTFQIQLNEGDAPLATQAFRHHLPIEGVIVHSMWSGPMGLMGSLNLNDAPLENPSAFLSLGDIAYHPDHHEIGIPYGATQWREPVGSVYVARIGRIEGDLGQLVELGRALQRTGAKKVAFR